MGGWFDQDSNDPEPARLHPNPDRCVVGAAKGIREPLSAPQSQLPSGEVCVL